MYVCVVCFFFSFFLRCSFMHRTRNLPPDHVCCVMCALHACAHKVFKASASLVEASDDRNGRGAFTFRLISEVEVTET